jgi:hypothetical protein
MECRQPPTKPCETVKGLKYLHIDLIHQGTGHCANPRPAILNPQVPYNENYIQPEDTFHLVAEGLENLPRSESEACKTPQEQIATKTDKSNMSLLNFMFSYLQGLLIAADHPGGFLCCTRAVALLCIFLGMKRYWELRFPIDIKLKDIWSCVMPHHIKIDF